MIEELTVGDVMIADPVTVSTTDVLEQAALLITEHKIGGMPVLEDGKLVGVITVVDILEAFIDIMGVLASSSRLDVQLSDSRDAFQQVSRIIREHNGEIISVGILRQDSPERIYSFRIEKCDTEPLRQALEEHGHRVVSYSPKKIRKKICDTVRVGISNAIFVQQFNRKGGEASLCRPEASAGALALVA
jgi:acetoin utilization protein AcuB